MELVGIEDRVGNEPQIMEIREEEVGGGEEEGRRKEGSVSQEWTDGSKCVPGWV